MFPDIKSGDCTYRPVFTMPNLVLFQSQILGIGFLKIHAPWNVLCREAEFMKLKMPTKKVFIKSVNCLIFNYFYSYAYFNTPI